MHRKRMWMLVVSVAILAGCAATQKGMTDMGVTTPQLTQASSSGTSPMLTGTGGDAADAVAANTNSRAPANGLARMAWVS